MIGSDEIRPPSRDKTAADEYERLGNTPLRPAAPRNYDLIWEITQSGIAVAVVLANVAGVFLLKEPSELLANSFFLIVGFYFGRTNHTRAGHR